jgi:hypothetical protein
LTTYQLEYNSKDSQQIPRIVVAPHLGVLGKTQMSL